MTKIPLTRTDEPFWGGYNQRLTTVIFRFKVLARLELIGFDLLRYNLVRQSLPPSGVEKKEGQAVLTMWLECVEK